MRAIGDWCKDAACRNDDPNKFFTGVGQNPTEARELCPTCPVKDECLNYGIMYDEAGVWGGKTERERKQLPPFIKTALINEAKSLGLYENRPSIESLVGELTKNRTYQTPEPDEQILELLEPLAQQLMAEYDPIFRVAS